MALVHGSQAARPVAASLGEHSDSIAGLQVVVVPADGLFVDFDATHPQPLLEGVAFPAFEVGHEVLEQGARCFDFESLGHRAQAAAFPLEPFTRWMHHGGMPDRDPILVEAMDLLRARQWYAAHEAIELVWLTAVGDERLVLQGLIHATVALEHLSRGNPRGALSQWRKAQPKIKLLGPRPWGLEIEEWRARVDAFFSDLGLDHRAQAQSSGLPMDRLPDEDSWPVPAGV